MTTINKKKSTRKVEGKPNLSISETAIAESDQFQEMAISEIDICKRNYRLIFPKKEMENFATELKLHGIISSLMVRPMPDGRFELVAGERRYRAAQIAKLETVPVQVRVLTDQQAKEIRLAENIHRENVHPLHEAFAVKDMLEAYSKIEEVAKRMGKSKAWVYSRIKIAGLIDPLQEMFLDAKLTLLQAEEIASLSPESQSEFFIDNCEDWQNENFELEDVPWMVERLKCDLNKARFDTTDKDLFPEAGACSACPFNTATLNYLFPELAKEAKCSNSNCYSKKCYLQNSKGIIKAFEEHKPDAILYPGYIDQETREIIEGHPEMSILPLYAQYTVDFINAPAAPDTEDYEQVDEDGVIDLDESGYNQALQEYQDDLESYHAKVMTETTMRGLLISNDKYLLRLFEIRNSGADGTGDNSSPKVTAKEVQQAIKEGTATAELLQQEINRLNDRETRFKEIDLDKIQEQVHDKFKAQVLSFPEIRQTLTQADHVALRLIVYQALGWESKSFVEDAIMPDMDLSSRRNKENLYNALAAITDEQFCFMIRAVLSGDGQSKYPGNVTGYALYQCADASGIDVNSICKEQQEKATIRGEKKEEKIQALEKRIEKMKQAA